MNAEITSWEETAVNAFPALASEVYDGWLLCFSEGYTYRANCVYPLYAGEEELAEKIAECERRYFSRRLPCVFKLTAATPEALDGLLTARGYDKVKTVRLMRRTLAADFAVPAADAFNLEIFPRLHLQWLEHMLQFTPQAEGDAIRLQCDILKRLAAPAFYLQIKAGMRCVGTCMAVLERGRIGLFSLHVDRNFQRQGLGAQLCEAALAAGARRGAKEAYLQVSEKNWTALRLYEKLGFQMAYVYWFREKRSVGSRKIID